MLSLKVLLTSILLARFGAFAEDNSTLDLDPVDYYTYEYPYYYYSPEYYEETLDDDHEKSAEDDQVYVDIDSDECFLCINSTNVPHPDLVLRDETCEDWNGIEFDTDTAEDTAEVCEIVQTTYGSACGCPSPPEPKCKVCENGDYIWLEDPTFFSYVDDVCVKIISDMSFDEDICKEAKDDVAKLCCISGVISLPQQEFKNPKGSKSDAYVLKRSGKTKFSKGEKARKSDMYKFTTEPTLLGSTDGSNSYINVKSFKENKNGKSHKAIKAGSIQNMEINSTLNPGSKVKTGKVSLHGKTQKGPKGSKRIKSAGISDTNTSSHLSTKTGKTKAKKLTKVKKTKHHYHYNNEDDYYLSGDEEYS
jgi:hypothetical protein